jgi:hypothetical protein
MSQTTEEWARWAIEGWAKRLHAESNPKEIYYRPWWNIPSISHCTTVAEIVEVYAKTDFHHAWGYLAELSYVRGPRWKMYAEAANTLLRWHNEKLEIRQGLIEAEEVRNAL